MLKVHHLNNSRSHRILWLLEELSAPYEIVPYRRDAKTNLAPPELKKIHPLGKAPVIEDEGRVIAESGAIIEYILRKYGTDRLRPADDSPAYIDYSYWMHFAEGSAMLPPLLHLYASRAADTAAIQPRIKGQIEDHLNFMNASLAGKDWLLGREFSAADIQLGTVIEFNNLRVGLKDYPNLQAFVARCHARPGYKRAVEKGGELFPVR